MNQNNQTYRTGQYVEGTVERLLPYGLFVQLNDGTRAYIRRRELTWSGNIDPRESWQAGDKIEGQVLKLAEAGQLLELSHRATLPDPWDGFVSRHRQGDVVEGTVKNLTNYGVYLEVEPGVDGLIPLAELADRQVERPEEVVWVGDVVEAVITYLDGHTKKLRLSVQARLQQLKTVAGVIEQCNLFSPPALAIVEPNETRARDQVSAEVQFDLRAKPDLDPLAMKRVGRILVIDDYEAIRLSLVEWLQNLGYEVDEASDVAEAFQKIRATSYGLLLVDLNLPGIDGVAFIRQIRSKGINCHVALMSTAEWLDKRQHDIEAVGAVEILVKPLDRTEIEHLLAEIGAGTSLPTWPKRPKSNQPKAPESFDQLAEAISTKGPLTVQLQAGLEQLVATTPAEMGLIFYLNPFSQEVSILAQAGQAHLKAEAIHELCASPVRDVIIDGEQILENQLLGIVKERFRKLLDLLSFEACIGLPLQTNGETNHALFLFHPQSDVFNRYHLRDALAASSLFSTAIERQTMEDRFCALNKLLLSGQLASGFSHEVYNKMSGLEFQLRNLQIDCGKFGCQSHRPGASSSFAEIREAVDGLLATFYDLKETVELFQQLMRAETEQTLDLNEIVQRTLSLLRPVILAQRIRLETNLSPDLSRLVSSPMRLQQVFLNLMLNAVQQMVLQQREGMTLSVATSYEPLDQGCPVKVRFSDTGPGIHKQLWDKIFDLGFTTRPEGTGQGLYIARSLIESLGGKLLVEQSVISIGTTFLVELPLTSSLREEHDPTTVTRAAGG